VARPLRLVEGIDFYREGELMVFTAHYLLKRGYCCNSGCRHCPFRDDAEIPLIDLKIIGATNDDER
jgi:hypothetical protein